MYGSADFFTLCKMTSGKMRGKWGTLAGASLCFHVIMGAANHAVGGLAGIVLAPLNAGLGAILLSAMEEKEIKVGMLFSKFDEYGRYVWGVWRPALFTLLWGLLLIIPGLIASLRYSQSLYLMLDDPSLNAKEAMEHCMETITMRMPEDFISLDLQDANRALGEITGDTSDDEIIDRIFTKICLGK